MRYLMSILAILLLGPALSFGQELGYGERFAGVKEWDFVFVYSSSSPYQFNEGPVSYNRQTFQQSHNGRARLSGHVNGNQFMLEGTGSGEASYSKSTIQSSQFFTKTRTDVGGGSANMHVDVTIDLKTGNYRVSFQPGMFKCIYQGVDATTHSTNAYGPSEEELSVQIPTLPNLDEGKFKLPESGTIIRGEYSFQEQIAAMQKDADFDLHQWARRSPTSGSVQWILMPADVVDVKLLVEPQGYADWIPEAGKDEATAGNALKVKARLVDKKTGGAPSIKARTMTYRVIGGSREPGIAINAPLKDAKRTPDLAFDEKLHAGWQISDESQTAVTAPGAYESTEATVSAYDYGAYGSLMVTAELDNGRVVVGEIAGASEPILALPKRTGASCIADKWKQTIGYDGADDDDTDKQQSNTKPGDGLSAYEEYRGMLVKGVHSRKEQLLNPKRKDLVIENQIGAQVRSGMKLFETASDVRVVELDKGELPESRQVNINYLSSHAGDQFGMRLVADKPASGGAGENQPADKLGKTPKDSQRVVVDLDYAASAYAEQAAAAKASGATMPYTAADDLDNTVAHEIAHGVGCAHHGKETDYRGPKEVKPNMRDYSAYSAAGHELMLSDAPGGTIKLSGTIGRPGNTASGDSGCIMAYTGAYAWAAVGPAGGPYKFYSVGLQPVGKHFCTSDKAAGFNVPRKSATGKDLPGYFGDATSVGQGIPAGNCLGQMRVRDW